jgi:hypothetical protein
VLGGVLRFVSRSKRREADQDHSEGR